MITQSIQNIIIKAISSIYGIENFKVEISYPDPRFGDFATNAAFGLARQLERSPQDIATELAGHISDSYIKEATSTKGFINLKMTESFWVKQLQSINPKYGSGQISRPEKVQVEFISANPTGPLTLGNARGGYVGDVIANVLSYSGHQVTREYYFNDAGTQINTLVNSVKAASGLTEPQDSHYPGQYIKDLAAEFSSELKVRSDEELASLITEAILKRFIHPAIAKMNIDFDEWFSERSLVKNGSFERLLQELQLGQISYEKDGATWLKSTQYGDDRDRVLRKSNGDVTYLGTDIAYHRNIFEERQFDRAVKVWVPIMLARYHHCN